MSPVSTSSFGGCNKKRNLICISGVVRRTKNVIVASFTYTTRSFDTCKGLDKRDEQMTVNTGDCMRMCACTRP